MLNRIQNNLDKYSSHTSFFIENNSFTFNDLKQKITQVYSGLKELNISRNDVVAVISNNDLETYASVFAIWFAGGTFLPLNPKHPIDRNIKIVNQVDIKCLVSSNELEREYFQKDLPFIYSKKICEENYQLKDIEFEKDQILYLIFTSGSTGIPKGVQISLENLESFIRHFLSVGYDLDHNDRFLQIYDLSFDASFHCYVLPIYLGASVYTVNPLGIKYLEAIKLMKNHKLTFAKMPPSTLTFLKPYLPSVKLPYLRYSLFGGEALSFDLMNSWKDCVPNAEIHNVYGPTEATINCLYYKCPENTKSYNGIVSIGKPTSNLKTIVVDENGREVKDTGKGELYVSGNQITPGYIKNVEKNKLSFLQRKIKNKIYRFYKTGDLVFRDEDGDFYYVSRIDNQVQIQGYRVELGEIENVAREISGINNCIILVNEIENTPELVLVLENFAESVSNFENELALKIPNYMMPDKIISVKQFPYNFNGKIDINRLKKMILT